MLRNIVRISRARRRSFFSTLEALERREVLSTTPVLMTNGGLASQPTWGQQPDPSDLSGSVNTLFTPVSSITTDIHGNKIDFNKDGYADLLENGRADALIGYGTSTASLVSASREGFGKVAFGGPNGLTFSTKGFNAVGSVVCQFSGEATAVADLNGDGYQDILTTTATSTTGPGAKSLIQFWDPVQQAFTSAVDGAAFNGWAWKTGQMTVGDVNGDGVPDVVLPTFSTTAVPDPQDPVQSMLPLTGFEVYLGKINPATSTWTGDFETSAYSSVTLRQPNISWGISVGGNGVLRGVTTSISVINSVLADLNGDGKLDLAIPEADGITVFANPGDGKFTQASGTFVQSAGAAAGLNLVAGDFNHDGKQDLASSPNYVSEQLSVDTSPSFSQWEASTAPISVFMNTTTTTGGAMSFSLNSVAGFEAQSSWNGTIALADFNGDGNLDIGVASASNNSIYYGILAGDGTGQFGALKIYVGYSNDADGYDSNFKRAIRYISAADFNNDGQVDIASAAYNVGPTGSYSSFGNLKNSAVGITGISYNKTFLTPGVDASSVIPASVGVPYSQQLKPTGGDPSKPYIYTLSPNSVPLPAGLTLSSSGLLSGTPTQSGPFQLLLNITQTNGPKGKSFADLVVNGTSQGIITPTSVPNAVLNVPFNQQFTSSGGPATWAVTHGALPPGLTLSSSGQLTGTPTGTGEYNFQLTATGQGTQSSLNYIMVVQSGSVISAAPTVTNLARYGYHNQPTVLVLAFSQSMNVASASNVKNYTLVSAGKDGIFGSRDDKSIALASAVYSTSQQAVTLASVQRNYPLRQKYRLTINGTPTSGLKSESGTFLAGTGSAGTNYVRVFSSEVLAGPYSAAKAATVKAARRK